MTQPVTEADRELISAPSISDQMPVTFANGAAWQALIGYCKGCGAAIAAPLFRGRISRIVDATATVRAVGICHPCKLLTRFEYRLHDDLTITGQREGQWCRWQPYGPRRMLGVIASRFRTAIHGSSHEPPSMHNRRHTHQPVGRMKSNPWIEIEKMDDDVKRRAIERGIFWDTYRWPIVTAGLFALTLISVVLNHLGYFPGEQSPPAVEATFLAIGAGTFHASTFLSRGQLVGRLKVASLLLTVFFIGVAIATW